jgi:hypothetical protein
MKYHVIIKPKKFMYPYIAVNSDLPKNELPKRMRHMHRNTIYIRDDIVKHNPERELRILLHEYREMRLIEKGYKYKTAHRKAGY